MIFTAIHLTSTMVSTTTIACQRVFNKVLSFSNNNTYLGCDPLLHRGSSGFLIREGTRIINLTGSSSQDWIQGSIPLELFHYVVFQVFLMKITDHCHTVWQLELHFLSLPSLINIHYTYNLSQVLSSVSLNISFDGIIPITMFLKNPDCLFSFPDIPWHRMNVT